MWTDATRAQHCRTGERYASDLTDAQWAVLAPLMPAMAAKRNFFPCRASTQGVPRGRHLFLKSALFWAGAVERTSNLHALRR